MNVMNFIKKNGKYMLLGVPFIIMLIIPFLVADDNKQINVFTKIENLTNLFGIVSAILSIMVINSVDKIKKDLVEEKNNAIIENIQKASLKENFETNINTMADFINSLSIVHLASEKDNIAKEINYLKDKKILIYNLISDNVHLFSMVSQETKYKKLNFIKISKNVKKLEITPPNKPVYQKLEQDLRGVEQLLMLINHISENN